MKLHPKLLTSVALLLASATALSAATMTSSSPVLPPPPAGYVEPSEEALRGLLASPEDLRWHQDAKLGFSIHWGPVALTGVPMSWGRYGPRFGAGKNATSGIPAKEYDQLYQRFNPVKFDADEWVSLFKRAGGRYFYFTSKHHDGFCMFDSALTDYDIMSTPFKRDVCGELAAAGQGNGVKVFWYFSQPDWVHPNALQAGHYEKYLPYMKEQIGELLNNYGKVDGLWFDHLGSKHYHWDTVEFLPTLRREHPGLLFNNRVGNGLPNEYQGDWYVYELRVGPYEEPRMWECNTTLTKAWAWHGGDLVKPFETIRRLLLQVVGNGGNLLLNLGPKPDGEIQPKEREVLTRLGEWMDLYGDAIYGTRKGVYKPGPWGGSAVRGNDLFLYVLQQTADGSIEVELPRLAAKPLSVELLTPGTLKTRLMRDWWVFGLSDRPGNAPAIIKLSFDSDPSVLGPVETYPLGRKLAIASIKASSERDGKFSAAALLDLSTKGVFGEGIHIKSWWAPGKGDDQPWLELVLPEPEAIRTLMISESMRAYAVRRFRVSYADSKGQWHAAFEGTSIGEMLAVRLDTPPTQRVRIDFLQTEDSPPNITSVELFRQ